MSKDSLTPAESRLLINTGKLPDRFCPPKKPSKYRNKRKVVDGINFDSTKEANRYEQLKRLETAHEITDLRLQVPFPFYTKEGTVSETYVADFVYVDSRKGYVVEDVKGKKTPEYLRKKRLMFELWKIEIYET